MVQDRLACGIANDSWQKRLLAEDKLTFDKAKKLLTALEAAEKGTRDLAPESNKQIHYLPRSRPRRRDPPACGPQASLLCTTPSSGCKHCGAALDPKQC